MIHLGLTGYPLGHTLSPMLHEAALRASHLEGTYSLFPIRPGDRAALDLLVKRIRGGELTGFNITIPHKQAVIHFLDELTPTAEAIGAVNVVYLKDGRAVGDNTDAAGFLADLDGFLPAPRSALVIGAGGAARSVVYALTSIGADVSVAARRIEQARAVAGSFAHVNGMALGRQTLEGANAQLIVNATPVGMFPEIDKCPWPIELPLPGESAIYDLVYNPPETRLIQRAIELGLRASNGLGMLVQQAALAFEMWTGQDVRPELLFEAIGQTAR